MNGEQAQTAGYRPSPARVLAGALALAVLASATLRLAGAGQAVAPLPWQLVGLALALPAVAVAHYLSAAVALRAASATPLRLRTTAYAQLSAAAVNRLVPNGLGGNALNLRFLGRCGASPAGAVSALATLALVGGLTDGLYAALVTSAGPRVGVHGAAHEVRLLANHGLRVSQHGPWFMLVALAVGTCLLLTRRPLPRLSCVRRSAGHVAAHVGRLLRRPRNILALALASLATTAALSAGFVMTALAVAHGHPLPPVGALIAMYLLGSAIGGAAPVPAVAGLTEAALVTALSTTGLPFATALAVVLIFRLVTFWLPLPLGLLAARRLHACGLL